MHKIEHFARIGFCAIAETATSVANLLLRFGCSLGNSPLVHHSFGHQVLLKADDGVFALPCCDLTAVAIDRRVVGG